MKLIIRSQYWGNVLKGKTRVDAANHASTFRTISSQAVVSIEGKYWGCCQGQGKRVLEMTETHFVEFYSGDWDLYMIGSTSTESQAIHAFFLLPQNQISIDVTYHTYYSGWNFVGTVPAVSIRKSLEELLEETTFKPNETIGYRYHHVHIEILMPQVVDYAARARKAKSNPEPEVGTVSSTSDREDINGASPVPTVENTLSQDATSTTEASSPITTTSYQEVPRFVPAGSFDQDFVCYPVAMQFHPAMHGPMYHDPHYPQGYPMISNGMAMVPMAHAGLAPYMHAYPVPNMQGWSLPQQKQEVNEREPAE